MSTWQERAITAPRRGGTVTTPLFPINGLIHGILTPLSVMEVTWRSRSGCNRGLRGLRQSLRGSELVKAGKNRGLLRAKQRRVGRELRDTGAKLHNDLVSTGEPFLLLVQPCSLGG